MKSIVIIAGTLAFAAGAVQAGDIKVARKITYANPAEIKEAVRKECGLEEALGSYLADEAHDKVQVVDSVKGAKGKVLDAHITGVWSMGGPWGGASVEVQGKLLDNGKEVGSVTARRQTSRGGYGACGKLNVSVKKLAEDLAGWLDNPVMDARLGDTKK